MLKHTLYAGILVVTGTMNAVAGPDDFEMGPVIEGYGPVAVTEEMSVIPPETVFKLSYDVSEAGPEDAPNRSFLTAARFLNMHNRAGVPVENMHLAIVVHGPAGMDLVNDERRGTPNPNSELIEKLIAAGVSVQLCGQTSVYRDIAKADLLPGVEMPVSAMTAHAQLQAEGYALSPF